MAEPVGSFVRLRTLCEGALELPRAQRREWVERMCEGDRALADEVLDLLARVERGGPLAELLDRPPPGPGGGPGG